MAELVGREISTITDDGRPPPPAGGMNRSHSFDTRTGATTIATNDVRYDTTRLYTLVEEVTMSIPAPTNKSANELRSTEVVRMREMLNSTWDSIREWLAAHPSSADRQQAAQHQGQFLTTALHMVCKLNDPPVDVVEGLIECAEETVEWPDSNGWLPLHHACANGASGRVLSVLVQAYPEGKVRQDRRFRTPLHFAFFRRDANDDSRARNPDGGGAMGGDGDGNNIMNRGDNLDGDGDDDVGNSMPEIVKLLADSGAAELQDEGGMVSFHCVFVAVVYFWLVEIISRVLNKNIEDKTCAFIAF